MFQLTPNGGSFTKSVVYSFKGSANNDGALPQGELIADATGNFYGVTSGGGAKGCGTVFKLTPGSGNSWTESILYSFCTTAADGVFPSGKLLLDGAGNLYGVAQLGGAIHGGTVYQLTPSSGTWSLTVLHSFPMAGHTAGSQPVGIIFDSAGNIDGVTLFGGTLSYNGAGIVFQLVQNAQGHWRQRVIHTFSINGTNLETPTGGLVLDGAGNLYMTMGRGGRGGGGGIFELSPYGGGNFRGHGLYSFRGPLQPATCTAQAMSGAAAAAGSVASFTNSAQDRHTGQPRGLQRCTGSMVLIRLAE